MGLIQLYGAGGKQSFPLRIAQKNKSKHLFFTRWCSIVNEVRTLIEEDLTSGNKVWFVYNRAKFSDCLTSY